MRAGAVYVRGLCEWGWLFGGGRRLESLRYRRGGGRPFGLWLCWMMRGFVGGLTRTWWRARRKGREWSWQLATFCA